MRPRKDSGSYHTNAPQSQYHNSLFKPLMCALVALCTAVLCALGLSGCGTPNHSGEATPQKSASSQATAEQPKDQTCDVVVVGSGTTGIIAAIQAHDAGAKVILLEKMPVPGGNSVRAEGGMNAAGTAPQKAAGIDDTPDLFYADTMKGGHDLSNPEILRYFVDHSSEAIDWLLKEGMDVNEVAQAAGASKPRMHRPVGGASIGAILVDNMLKQLDKRELFVRTNQNVYDLIKEGDKVTGVKVKDEKTGSTYTVKADAVVLTTGGFGANPELLVKYRPDLEGFGTTNHAGATGDGIKLAQNVGADTVDMDQIQTNPTVEPNTMAVISESVRGNGAIFVNANGVRFDNEMGTRDVLSASILKQPNKYAYEIFDQGVRQRMKAIEKHIEQGIVVEGATPEELAGKIGVDPAAFAKTIADWNKMVADKTDTAFGRTTGMDHDLSTGPYYAIKVAPAVHYTMGGIKIDNTTAVIGTDGKAIPGLYAAGETTGGLHGGNRLGGNAVADTVIFGKRAGEIASEFALKNGSLLNTDELKAEYEAQKQNQAHPDKDAPALYKDGTYTGKGTGKEGTIELTVEVKGGQVVAITTVSHHDTPTLYASAEEAIFPHVIASQSLDADGVSGATFSSNGIKEALKDALKDAKK